MNFHPLVIKAVSLTLSDGRTGWAVRIVEDGDPVPVKDYNALLTKDEMRSGVARLRAENPELDVYINGTRQE